MIYGCTGCGGGGGEVGCVGAVVMVATMMLVAAGFVYLIGWVLRDAGLM